MNALSSKVQIYEHFSHATARIAVNKKFKMEVKN